jgi:hypothetical protein
MAAFFLLLALIGGALVGDLVWENTANGEVTVLDRTFGGYPQGWLLAAAAGIGFVVALLLVASVSSTKGRRNRRRQLRAIRHGQREQAYEPDHAAWVQDSLDRQQTSADPGRPPQGSDEPLYEQTRQSHLDEDRRRRQ